MRFVYIKCDYGEKVCRPEVFNVSRRNTRSDVGNSGVRMYARAFIPKGYSYDGFNATVLVLHLSSTRGYSIFAYVPNVDG